jgi:hypothetical protein
MPTGASEQQILEYGREDRLDHVWRHGVYGYCGVDPINIRFLLNSAFDKGAHNIHLETVCEAGKQIGETTRYSVRNMGGR